MNRREEENERLVESLPLAGGDESSSRSEPSTSQMFAPRMRGWIAASGNRENKGGVCPSREGMIRGSYLKIWNRGCLPLAGGDDSIYVRRKDGGVKFALRMRGWIEFLTNLHLLHLVCPSLEGMIRIMMEKYNGTTCLPLVGGDDSGTKTIE